jgi:hypothetical protein
MHARTITREYYGFPVVETLYAGFLVGLDDVPSGTQASSVPAMRVELTLHPVVAKPIIAASF